MSAGRATLARVAEVLAALHPEPVAPPTRDPFELVLWTQVAYLAGDAKHLAAFRALEQRVGLSPAAIAGASLDVLAEVARMGGGTAVAKRAARMQASAARVLEHFDGELSRVLARPEAEAIRELARFDMIGKPGAEVILLLCGVAGPLGLDSNGLRVLVRLGYGRSDARYERTYASVRADVDAAARELDAQALRELHLLLRQHGRSVCRNSKPDCAACPLRPRCPAAERLC